MGLVTVPSTQSAPFQGNRVTAGRFILSADIPSPIDIKIFDPQDASTTTIRLSDFKASYVTQLKSSNGSIYRAKAIVPHADGTFTVVSMGGVISHWTCEKVKTEAERLLSSVQVPDTLMSRDQVIQVDADGDQISVRTSQGNHYLYAHAKLTC